MQERADSRPKGKERLFEMRPSSSLVVQGADAALAGGIAVDLKAASEQEGRLGIDCLFQCELI